MSWLTGNWSEMYPVVIDDTRRWYEGEGVTARCGVYRLIGVDENESPARINRVCGVDPTGTLYIGAATNGLDGRLGSLVTTHRGHGGGNHIPLPEKLKQRFPPERLRIVWEVCAGDPYTREGELKGAYEDEFGERPPHDRA